MNEVINCNRVDFSYNGLSALRGLTFKVEKGQVFALLGPNGAGKTTTIRILNGLLRPGSGSSTVLGMDPVLNGALIRRRTGVLTETPALYERLSAWQNLNFFGSLAGMSAPEISERGNYYLEILELNDRANDRVESFSKGMKQRLALARALLHDPELLFLDEPTSGMDPAAARQVEELIYRISKRENRSVILCTHRLYEAEKVCDQVAVMKKGSIIASGSLESLRQQYTPEIKVRFGFGTPPKAAALETAGRLSGVKDSGVPHPLEWEASVDSVEVVPRIINYLVTEGVSIQSVIPCQATLEEIYLRLQQIDAEVKK
jgi:ABC-2 type transport system ATP-binding protein